MKGKKVRVGDTVSTTRKLTLCNSDVQIHKGASGEVVSFFVNSWGEKSKLRVSFLIGGRRVEVDCEMDDVSLPK